MLQFHIVNDGTTCVIEKIVTNFSIASGTLLNDPDLLATYHWLYYKDWPNSELVELLSDGRLAPSSAAARFGSLRVAEAVLGRRVFKDASHLFALLPTLLSTTPTDIVGINEA